MYYSYDYYYSLYHCSEPWSFCLPLFLPALDSSFLFVFFILEAGERCGSTPVQFLHCSLPLPLTSARTCGAVIFIVHFKENKHNMDLSILLTVISRMFVCPLLSLILYPLDLYISFLHLFPSLLPPFVTLLLSLDLLFRKAERKLGEVRGG